MDKLSRDCASLVILGIACIFLAILLLYGLVGRQYYVNIDTISIVHQLMGWNIGVTILVSLLLPPVILTIGLWLISCAFE